MMKRWTALLALSALTLSLLTACGGSADDASPSAGASEAVSAGVSEAPAESPEPSEEPSAGVSDPAEGESADPEPSISPTLTLSMTDATITYAGYVLTLTPTFTGTDSTNVTWISDDETVATVDQSGNVTSVAPGKTVITAAADNGLTATCIVRCRWTETAAPSASPSAAPSQAPSSGVDLSALAQTLIGGYELPASLTPADTEVMDAFYPGLSAISASQRLVYVTSMSINMGELALIEVESSGDVSAVKSILQARIDSMVNGGAWYPEATELWANSARIASSGRYILLAVSADCDAIVSDFLAAVG